MSKRKHTIKIPVNFAGATYATSAPIFNADLASGVTSSIGTQSIFIPENATISVTFSSVSLHLGIQDFNSQTSVYLGTFSSIVTLTGAAASQVYVSQAANVLSVGSNFASGVIGPIDYTNYFNSNFGPTNSSKVATVQVLCNWAGTPGTPGLTSRGVYGYFDITYVYDDVAPRRINTICVPYESQVGGLSFSAAGKPYPIFSVMPQLTGANGWLNSYANLGIRYRWLELKTNAYANNTANPQMKWTFDLNTATSSLPTRVTTTNNYQVYQINALTYSTTATHSFSLWSTSSTNQYFHSAVVNEWITYEFDVSGSTASLNYIELPISISSIIGLTAGTTASYLLPDRFINTFSLEEPGPIILRKAAIELSHTPGVGAASGIQNIAIRGTGSTFGQRFRTYSQNVNTIVLGSSPMQHGLDSTSSGGTGIGISTGQTSFEIDIYKSLGTPTLLTGMIKILYESGISSLGIDSHNHTIWEGNRNMSLTQSIDDIISSSVTIPESNYYINGSGYKVSYWLSTSGPDVFMSRLQQLSTDVGGLSGWQMLYNNQLVMSSLAFGQMYINNRPFIDLYPSTPVVTSFSPTYSRFHRISSNTLTLSYGHQTTYTYHSISSTLSGTIYGSIGGQVYLNLYQVSSNINYTIYATASQIGNGPYSFVVYDNLANYRVEAYESNIRSGISKTGTASTGFDILLIQNQTTGIGQG